MELNREQIVKALECCSDCNCPECPYVPTEDCHKGTMGCSEQMLKAALAIIRELTEECKKWQSRLEIECEYTKADTVRKMQESLKEKSEQMPMYSHLKIVYTSDIDQIAKEMLEDQE